MQEIIHFIFQIRQSNKVEGLSYDLLLYCQNASLKYENKCTFDVDLVETKLTKHFSALSWKDDYKNGVLNFTNKTS